MPALEWLGFSTSYGSTVLIAWSLVCTWVSSWIARLGKKNAEASARAGYEQAGMAWKSHSRTWFWKSSKSFFVSRNHHLYAEFNYHIPHLDIFSVFMFQSAFPPWHIPFTIRTMLTRWNTWLTAAPCLKYQYAYHFWLSWCEVLNMTNQ